jgi:cysteinyl-tRNA synthetase
MEQALAQWASFRDAFRVAHAEEDAPGWDEFAAALDDDFNTPEALAILHRWRAAGRLELLERGLAVFGLEPRAVEAAPEEVVALAEQRQAARERRDFVEADRLRDEIGALGWEVQDVAGGYRLIPRT